MSTTIIEKLLAAGAVVAGKVLRVVAGKDPSGNAQPVAVDAKGRIRTVHGPVPSVSTDRLQHLHLLLPVLKGGQNKLRSRLPVLGESQESSAAVMGSVSTYKIKHGAVTGGLFVVGEVITGGTSLATGVVTRVELSFLEYTLTAGVFVAAEIITGGTSAATTTSVGVSTPQIVGQIVKIPQNNVGGLTITLEADAPFESVDRFEAAQATMQLMWAVGVGAAAIRETSVVKQGLSSIQLDDTQAADYTHTIRKIRHDEPAGAFQLGETITGGTSAATAVIGEIETTHLDMGLVSVVGVFVLGEVITGGTSLATATTESPLLLSDDWSDFEHLSLQLLVNQKEKDQFLDLTISDGVNSSTTTLGVSLRGQWEQKNTNLQSLAASGLPAAVNLAAISSVTLATSDNLGAGAFKPAYLIYVDDLKAHGFSGSVDVKLFDMGATLPVSGVATLTGGTAKLLGDLGIKGSQALNVRVPLAGGKQQVNIEDYSHGLALEQPAETFLTPGNYFAVTVHYFDTDVDVYGADPALAIDRYPNGYAFTAPSEAGVITTLGAFHDAMFTLGVSVDVWIDSVVLVPVGAAGTKNFFIVGAEDASMNLRELARGQLHGEHVENLSFKERPVYLPPGGKFEMYYTDEFLSKILHMGVTVRYWSASQDNYTVDP